MEDALSNYSTDKFDDVPQVDVKVDVKAELLPFQVTKYAELYSIQRL